MNERDVVLRLIQKCLSRGEVVAELGMHDLAEHFQEQAADLFRQLVELCRPGAIPLAVA